MEIFFPRTVFFVRDAELALEFYTHKLGFTLDWTHKENGRAHVFQVSVHGLQLIINQAEESDRQRAGQGRVFMGLEDKDESGFRQYLADNGITPRLTHWGAPTLVINDLDGNELFFWLSEKSRAALQPQLANNKQ